MCGICGIWSNRGEARARLLSDVERMAETLVHRGPDGAGTFVDAPAGLALGHRRLSILDLSPAGRQPITSRDGRFVLVYNGELYNYRDLRAALGDDGFRSDCDSEVVVEAFARLGVENALKRFNGMFAFAAWDTQERTLFLGRDRLGIKPLYWGRIDGTLVFASELKAIVALAGRALSIDRQALTAYVRHADVPAPLCIYQGIQKLSPGTVVRLGAPGDKAAPVRFWSALDLPRRTRAVVDDRAAIDALEKTLSDAVQARMVADVPLGAFLSGGVDSSVVVALMRAAGAPAPRTFSIGFDDEGYNEAAHAKAVAHHLGTDHTELYVSPADARAVIPRLPTLYDEPFADSSQIPTFLVSRLARQHVTVALSGDGGDELFGGYNRHLWGPRVLRAMGPVPRRARVALSSAVLRVSPDAWARLFALAERVTPLRLRVRLPAEKLQKLAEVLPAHDVADLYRTLTSHFKQPQDLVVGARESPPPALPDLQPSEAMMLLDLLTYLPDDILTKVDRASMGESLEVRVPLLDHHVVEHAWSLPLSLKIREGQTKWILRQVLYRHVPRGLIERPKMGFGIPLGSWLRGPLKEWAGDLLAPARLGREGFFHPDVVTATWNAHLHGARNFEHHLWSILMFQAWLDETRGCAAR